MVEAKIGKEYRLGKLCQELMEERGVMLRHFNVPPTDTFPAVYSFINKIPESARLSIYLTANYEDYSFVYVGVTSLDGDTKDIYEILLAKAPHKEIVVKHENVPDGSHITIDLTDRTYFDAVREFQDNLNHDGFTDLGISLGPSRMPFTFTTPRDNGNWNTHVKKLLEDIL